MKMKIVRKEAFRAIGLKVTAPWQKLWIEMPKAWQELFAKADQIPHPVRSLMDISIKKEGSLYTQLIGAEVKPGTPAPAGFVAVDMPAADYVFMKHEGSLAEIATSFGAMLDWAREQGYETDDGKLDIGYTKDGLEKEHQLFVRLKR